MQVMVSGKHVDVGEALRSRVTDDLLASIGKYFERGGDADVVVSREGHSFRVDCVVALASGQRLLSHGQANDAHGAFSAALAKIETRIRRYKRRLKSHSVAAGAKAAETASLMVLRAPEEAEDDDDWGGDEAGHGAPAAMVIAETLEPLRTTGGKLFGGCYALYSGLLLVLASGIIIAPVLHRMFHQFHVDEEEPG